MLCEHCHQQWLTPRDAWYVSTNIVHMLWSLWFFDFTRQHFTAFIIHKGRGTNYDEMEKGSHVDVLLNIHSILIVLGSQFHAFDISIVVVVGNHQ